MSLSSGFSFAMCKLLILFGFGLFLVNAIDMRGDYQRCTSDDSDLGPNLDSFTFFNETEEGLLKRAAITTSNYKWPKTIYFRYRCNEHSEKTRKVIRNALKHIESKTCLRFKYSIKSSETPYLYFRAWADGKKCYSLVGRRSGGSHVVNLAVKSCFGKGPSGGIGIPVHEICHALGLYHEHQRPDRDDYVWVKPSKANSGDFRKLSWGVVRKWQSYDFGSIMHYPRSSNLAPKQKYSSKSIGQRNGLSSTDKKAINYMYCDKKREESNLGEEEACTPTNRTCASLGLTCGHFDDGCGRMIDCDSCASGQTCVEEVGRCEACATPCHKFATCNANRQCVCNSGFEGDGQTCALRLVKHNWTPVTGSRSWEVTGQFNSLKTSEVGPHVLRWESSKSFLEAQSANFSFTLEQLDDNTVAGPVVWYGNAGDYMALGFSSNSLKVMTFNKNGRRTHLASKKLSTKGSHIELQFLGSTMLIRVEGKAQYSHTFTANQKVQDVGVFTSNGGAKFNLPRISTTTRLSLQLTWCVRDIEFEAAVAEVMNVPMEQVTVLPTAGAVTGNCDNIEVDDEDSPRFGTRFLFELTGVNFNSEALATALRAKIASSDTQLWELDILPQTQLRSEKMDNLESAPKLGVTLPVTASSAAPSSGGIQVMPIIVAVLVALVTVLGIVGVVLMVKMQKKKAQAIPTTDIETNQLDLSSMNTEELDSSAIEE